MRIKVFCAFLFFVLFSGVHVYALSVQLPPKISLLVPPAGAIEGRDIVLYITIVHDPGQVVDQNSFYLEEAPLSVQEVHEERVAPKDLFTEGDAGLIVERYRAVLPKKSAGLYSIGPVAVKVDGIRYSSGAISLRIQGATVSDAFRLKAKILSPLNIFPGQEVIFEYQIFFQQAMQIVSEELPLLTMQGFLPVGALAIREQKVQEGTVQYIQQRAKATSPGTYEVPESILEAMHVTKNGGVQVAVPPLMRATVPSQLVRVLPFPDHNRPSYFTGALGSFVWRNATPDGLDGVVGKKIRVEYRVSGRGDLHTIQFPPLDSLAGLKQNFWVEEFAQSGQIDEGTKKFTLVLRPRHAGEEVEVPGFFFASFDSVTKRYISTTVPPVIFEVRDEAFQEKKELEYEGELAPPFELNEQLAIRRKLSMLLVVFLCVALFAIGVSEYILWKWMHSSGKAKKETSRELFYRAVMKRSKREEGLHLLRRAFYVRLFELGVLPTVDGTPEQIREEGIAQDVKEFLQLIDRELYQRAGTNIQEIYDEAAMLYHRLKER